MSHNQSHEHNELQGLHLLQEHYKAEIENLESRLVIAEADEKYTAGLVARTSNDNHAKHLHTMAMVQLDNVRHELRIARYKASRVHQDIKNYGESYP